MITISRELLRADRDWQDVPQRGRNFSDESSKLLRRNRMLDPLQLPDDELARIGFFLHLTSCSFCGLLRTRRAANWLGVDLPFIHRATLGLSALGICFDGCCDTVTYNDCRRCGDNADQMTVILPAIGPATGSNRECDDCDQTAGTYVCDFCSISPDPPTVNGLNLCKYAKSISSFCRCTSDEETTGYTAVVGMVLVDDGPDPAKAGYRAYIAARDPYSSTDECDAPRSTGPLTLWSKGGNFFGEPVNQAISTCNDLDTTAVTLDYRSDAACGGFSGAVCNGSGTTASIQAV